VLQWDLVRDRLLRKTIDEFQILELIGKGAVGRVYRADWKPQNKVVALKILEEGVFTPDDIKSRFLREAELVQGFRHPHIVPVYRSGQVENLHFIAMKLVNGPTLQDAFRPSRPVREALFWTEQVASALAFVHVRGVVHRDLKPSNILVEENFAYLADFGLARLMEASTMTASSSMLGTPLYMAPEQVRREPPGPWSDVFSMGVILYALCTGVHPFSLKKAPDPGSDSPRELVEVLDRIARCDFPPVHVVEPQVPDPLIEIITRAMQSDPARRYPNGDKLNEDLADANRLKILEVFERYRLGRTQRFAMQAAVTRPDVPPEAKLEKKSSLYSLEQLGKFRLLRLLGQGGMGKVYEAFQEDLDRVVAVKVLKHEGHLEDSEVERFMKEARAAARLSHPNILHVHEFGREGDALFYSMPLVQGRDLKRLAAEAPVDPRRAMEIVREAALAIQYAHEQGIVHRDLKPGNIMVETSGRVLVTDFGLAKEIKRPAEEGGILGTPGYMAPEQTEPGAPRVGPRTDVYGLGAVLYFLFSGRDPFSEGSMAALVLAVAREEPPPPRTFNPALPPAFEAVCLKAMAKDPDRRYASAAEMAEAVRQALAAPTRRWLGLFRRP
jgi:serine/threonine protein kinase